MDKLLQGKSVGLVWAVTKCLWTIQIIFMLMLEVLTAGNLSQRVLWMVYVSMLTTRYDHKIKKVQLLINFIWLVLHARACRGHITQQRWSSNGWPIWEYYWLRWDKIQVHRYLLHNRLGWWQQKGPPAAWKAKTMASCPFVLGTPGENLKPAVLVRAVELIVLKFQLVLGNYFRVYTFAAQIAESATNLIGWLNNHGKVRKMFDASQAKWKQHHYKNHCTKC